ncbi:ABC transporter substrate-binding protein [Micrococcus luteus]
MEMSRRAALGLGLSGLTLTAAGCTEDLRRPARPTPTPTPSQTGAPASVGRGDFLVVGAAGRPTARDPHLQWDSETFRLSRQVFETLLGVDPETGAAVPALAEHHEVTVDGRIHRFRLRKDVVFSDGAPCDADAVVANVERWARADEHASATASPFVSVFGAHLGEDDCRLDAVEAEDERTVRLTLSAPLHHLTMALTAPHFAVSSPASWDRTARTPQGEVRSPAGTGPYRWASVREAERILSSAPSVQYGSVLLPNTLYRGERPSTSPVVVAAWGRVDTRLREFRRGHADVIDVVSPPQLRPLVESGAQVLQRDPLSVLYLGMNTAHPVMGSLYIRQAVAKGVDRPALARSRLFLNGTAMAHNVVPPTLGVDNEDAERYDINPREARDLLELAGYDGEPLEFLYPTGTARPSMPTPELVYAMIAEDLGKIGLHIVPVPVPADQDYLRTVLRRGDRALHLMSRDGLYRDPHAFIEPLCRSDAAETNYDNPLVRELLKRAAIAEDEERRREVFRQIVASLALDLPVLPLVYPISATAVGARVRSYPTSPHLDEHFSAVRLSES